MVSILLDLIPDDLKSRARDAVVDVVTNQAEEHLGHDAARKLRGLRSDAAFLKAFDEGLQRALHRFVVEYEEQDEDLAAAIAEDPTIFENKEVQDALLTMLKRPGTYLVDEREQIVQTFASVLPTRKKRERVDRAVTYLLRCLAEELWHLPELQPVYSLHFQKGSYETLRQQLDLQKAQLMALTELNTGLRDALLQLADAIAAQKLLTPPQIVTLTAPPKILHNLPQPDYEHFVGREEELAEVHRLLSPQVRHFLITIDGIGGIGKSALALEAAHHYLRNYDLLPVETRFDAIVWVTAKRAVLTTDGIVNRRQPLRNLDDLYSAIAIALQREDITSANPETQNEVVRRALTRQRTLLVVDNLETVNDKQLLLFLRDELPAPTKAIVTTRRRIDAAYSIRLEGMPWLDAQRLIHQECRRKGVFLNEDDVRRVFDRTGGVPLAVVWSIALMGFGRSVDAVLTRLGEPSGDIARFCFEDSIEDIRTKPGYRLLMALGMFAAGTSRASLDQVTNFSTIDLEEGLSDLERLSLVNETPLNEQLEWVSLLPLTRSYVRLELSAKPDLRHMLFDRIVDYYRHFLTPRKQPSIGESYWEGMRNWPRRDEIKPHWVNISSLIRELLDCDRSADSLDLYLLTVYLMNEWGVWNERVELGRRVLAAAQQLRHPSEPWIAIDAIAWVLYNQGRYTECIDNLKLGRDAAIRWRNPEAQALAWAFEARAYLDNNRLDSSHNHKGANQAIHEALTIMSLDRTWVDETPLCRLVASRVAGTLAEMKRRENDYQESLRLSHLALDLRISIGEMTTGALSSLAKLYLNMGNLAKAGECLSQSSANAIKSQKDDAWLNCNWALLREATGDSMEAARLGKLAYYQFDRIGIVKGKDEAARLLERIGVSVE